MNLNKNTLKIINDLYMIDYNILVTLEDWLSIDDFNTIKINNQLFNKKEIEAVFSNKEGVNIYFSIDEGVVNHDKSLFNSIVDDGFKKVFYNDRFLKTDAIKIHSIDNIIISKGLNIDITPLDNSYSILDYKD